MDWTPHLLRGALEVFLMCVAGVLIWKFEAWRDRHRATSAPHPTENTDPPLGVSLIVACFAGAIPFGLGLHRLTRDRWVTTAGWRRHPWPPKVVYEGEALAYLGWSWIFTGGALFFVFLAIGRSRNRRGLLAAAVGCEFFALVLRHGADAMRVFM